MQGRPGAAVATLDLPTLERLSDLALSSLSAAREEIDGLNVYPVPDSDTGTNMFLTFEAAHEAMQQVVGPGADIRDALAAFARGALLGARGNSGVIFSQMVGALCKRLGEAGPGDSSAEAFADGLARATEASYAAVGEPVEGTILSVARAASDAAVAVARDPEKRLGHVIRAAAEAARDALARTPEQLRTLHDAGVVDAGGRALCVVLDAAEAAVTGRRPVSAPTPLGRHAIPLPLPAGDLSADGPAYEVMFLLDAEDDRIPGLRRALAPLGDSLVVVGGDGLWNVHVHVDDVGAAVEAGIAAGRPHRIRVTHFADQAADQAAGKPDGAGTVRRGRRVVLVSGGPGLDALYGEAGAVVVPGAPGRRPTTALLLEAVAGCGAAEVVLLPNGRDAVAVAEAAASSARDELDIRVAVIPTTAQVQGLAALAVHEPGRSFEQDVLEMTAAARHARSGAVTVAVKQAITMAGPCEIGDVLGAVEGDFVVVGADLFTVAAEILERLLGGGGELVTLVGGARHAWLAERCASYLGEAHPTVDVVVYRGDQERYPLLVGVE